MKTLQNSPNESLVQNFMVGRGSYISHVRKDAPIIQDVIPRKRLVMTITVPVMPRQSRSLVLQRNTAAKAVQKHRLRIADVILRSKKS